jgi:uracil-DNA glycosylase family protein
VKWLPICSRIDMAVKQNEGAESYVPRDALLDQLCIAVQKCKGCELYRHATQAVFGEGRSKARVVMVGEQPGDKEDLAGKPFVGPAGGVLDRALEAAEIDRAEVYITNAVKHFKFEERGKRRIHKKPSDTEIAACRPWLEAEFAALHPQITVCLGATALQAVLGKERRVLKDRGRFFDHPTAGIVTTTVHPSAILRTTDSDQREADFEAFVKDLKAVRSKLDSLT